MRRINEEARGRRDFMRGLVAGGAAMALGPIAGSAIAQSPVVLRVVSVWEKSLIWNRPLFEFINRVHSKSGGRLRLEWIGGPEAVPPFQSAESVAKGIFDLVHTSPTFFAASVPEANALYLAADVPLRRLYEAGVTQSFDEILRERLSSVLIGIPAGGVGFTYLTREPPRNLEYFRGRRIRTTPLYTPMLKALGASTVTIAPAETYSALERGVIDGVGWPLIGIVERKLQEVVKYILLPSFYDVRLCTLANVKVWDRLEPSLRTLLTETMHEVGDWGYRVFREESAKEQAVLQKAGMEKVSLPNTEARRYLRTADDAMWEAIIKPSPKYGPRLRKVFAKASARS